MSEARAFSPGDAVEYDSTYRPAKRNGCITYPSDKFAVVRGTYVQRLGDVYSDVQVGRKKLLVRTDRLRPASPSVTFQPPAPEVA